MYRLTRGAPYRAYRVHLLGRFRLALVALRAARPVDDGDLTEVSGGPRLDERDRSREAKTVDPPSRRDVVERVQDERESLEVRDVEPSVVEDVAVVGEVRRVAATAVAVVVVVVAGVKGRDHAQRGLGGDDALGQTDVLTPKEELAIQVRYVDGVEIDHLHVSEAAQRQVLQ